MSLSAAAINGLSAASINGRTTGASPLAGLASFELFFGCIHLVIVGPNEKDWLKVSRPHWGKGKPGTTAERNVARRAVEILNAEHRRRVDDSMSAMIAAWRRAAAELGHNPDTFLG